MLEFPISGVQTYWWLPPVFALVISCLSAAGGLSGAFLLLPFQISFLGFTGPAVSPTNLFYNIVAIPSGVVRYWREGRMAWSLAWTTIIGTLPGMFLGALIRLKWMPDPQVFKPFAGAVLLYLAARLVIDVLRGDQAAGRRPTGTAIVKSLAFTVKETAYSFDGREYRASTTGIALLSFMVGVIGGAYGIGGGAIMAPFFVAVFRLPVYTIAAATLFGTLVTSVMGVFFYWLLGSLGIAAGYQVSPDWMLGGLFGLGGMVGMYLGARLQRFLPARLIKLVLTLLLLSVSLRYIAELVN